MDYFYGRISNEINFWVLSMGLFLRLISDGMMACIQSLGSVLITFCFVAPMYFFRGIGGGDAKAFLCIAAFLGSFCSLKFIFIVLVLGSIAGIWKKYTKGGKRTKVKLGIYMPLAHVIITGMGGM